MATVLLGTTASVLAMSAPMHADLSGRIGASLAPATWADIALTGRDVAISGTAETDAVIAATIARVAALHGVRSVASHAVAAPLAEPFVFSADVALGAVTLRGAIFDERLRARLLELSGATHDETTLHSGAPDRTKWQQATEFGLPFLPHLEAGRVELAGLSLRISGQARSPEAFDQLVALAPPDGLDATIDVAPALVAPYQWRARLESDRIIVSGYVPNAELPERLRVASTVALPVATGLALGSGAPDGFVDQAVMAIRTLGALEQGEAVLEGGRIVVRGTPKSVELAQLAAEQMQSVGGDTDLKPAPLDDYWLSIDSDATGRLTVDGHVPDDAAKARLATIAKADVSSVEIAPDAPARFESGLEFGLKALAHLRNAQFAMHNSALTLKGTALSPTDYRTVMAQIEAGAPQGTELAEVAITPSVAAPYVWLVAHGVDGSFHVTGHVPDAETRQQTEAVIGKVATNKVDLASGAPKDFGVNAVAGLKALKLLDAGRFGYDGTRWSLTGTAASDTVKTEVETALSGIADARDWHISIMVRSAPAEAEASPEPVAEAAPETEPAKPEEAQVQNPAAAKPVDFTFAASRIGGGVIALSGNVPSESTKSLLSGMAGDAPITALKVSDAAPDGFVSNVIVGVRALALLKDGQLGFDGARWTLKGKAATPEAMEKAKAQIESVSTGRDWVIEIAGPPPVELCRTVLADFAAHTSILFKSGSAILEAESVAALDRVAKDLGLCPEAIVHVEGHTDADGPEDTNLALSVARAEAVIAALIADGVDEQRLYAVGYGESMPIAPNDTKAGKQANRRIVFTVLDK